MLININPILEQYNPEFNEMFESRRIGILVAKELQKHTFMTWTKFPREFGNVSSEAMMCNLLNTMSHWFKSINMDVDFGKQTRKCAFLAKSTNMEEKLPFDDEDEYVEVVTEENLRTFKMAIKEFMGKEAWSEVKDMNADELERWVRKHERKNSK